VVNINTLQPFLLYTDIVLLRQLPLINLMRLVEAL